MNLIHHKKQIKMRKIILILALALILSSQIIFGQAPSSVPTNGLVVYWTFNGNANDESGNGNNATIIGSVSLIPDWSGNINSAYNFPGNSSSYIDCNNMNEFWRFLQEVY
jgi:hypothetical protein